MKNKLHVNSLGNGEDKMSKRKLILSVLINGVLLYEGAVLKLSFSGICKWIFG